MKLTITGNVPSQKNRKIISKNFKTGNSFLRSAPAVKEWQAEALRQLKQQFQGYKVTDYPIDLTLIFFFENKRRHDLDNALSTVMDALAAPWEFILDNGKEKPVLGSGVIRDDSVDYVQCITVQYGGIDKINPRVEIYLDE